MRPSLLFLLILLSSWAHAWKVEGLIIDEEKVPLGFVNIFIQGTSIGTVSNAEGYFQIDIPHPQAKLEFRFVGYETYFTTLNQTDSSRFLHVQMKPRDALLQEAVINAQGNLADGIMRQVIQNRAQWDIEAKDYACDVYIKGLQRAEDVPDRFLGQEIEYDELGLDSNGSGILYLFESINELHFSAPKTYQEQIRSTQVSGENNAFSLTRASNLVLDYNRTMVPCFDMERGVASPIGAQGFFYYSYQLEGSYYDGDKKFYRIHFEPKRKNDPAGTGILIIRDSLFYTQSIQMTLYRRNQLSILDSLQLNTEYQVFEAHYLPVSTRLQFGLNIFNIGVTGYYFTQYLSYDFEGKKPLEKRPKMEVLFIDDEANKRDSSYWANIRPVPLTPIEQSDYIKKDSIQVAQNAKQDSATDKGIGWNSLWASTVFRSANRRMRFEIRGLARSLQFNTVEGLVFEPKLEIQEFFPQSKDLKGIASYSLRYGFSNTRLGGRIYSERYYRTKIPLTLWTEAAFSSNPVDGNLGMTETWNSIYSLLLAQNNLKFYQRTRLAFGLRAKVANGLELSSGLATEVRRPLNNTTDFSFRKDRSTYTPNVLVNSEQPNLPAHSLNLVDIGFRFTPFNRYITTPNGKRNLGSAWPTFSGKYTVAFSDDKKATIHFQKLDLRMDWDRSLGVLGNMRISAKAGTFLDRTRVYAPDFFHFATNPSFFQRGEGRMLRFQTLTPYSYSTAKSYGQLHIQHNFDGFLLNKIPGVRKLRAREFLSMHALAVQGRKPYYEFSFGLEQLALNKKDPGLLRIEFIFGTSGTTVNPAFRIGYAF